MTEATGYNIGLDRYAGRRINSHLFVRYQQRFRQTDFFSTFVRKLNFNNLIGLTVWAGRAMNTSTAASPKVACNIIRAFFNHETNKQSI